MSRQKNTKREITPVSIRADEETLAAIEKIEEYCPKPPPGIQPSRSIAIRWGLIEFAKVLENMRGKR